MKLLDEGGRGGRWDRSWERMFLAWEGVTPVLRRMVCKKGVRLGSAGGMMIVGVL